MNNLLALIRAHPTLVAFGVYYVLSAAIGSLPMPDATSGKGYRWFFGFANTLAANVTRALASRLPKDAQVPQAPTKQS